MQKDLKQSFFTIEQVSDLLQLHPQTVRDYVRQGKIKAFKLGKGYRISKKDLDIFIGRLRKRGVKK